jgi:hypothetical protein
MITITLTLRHSGVQIVLGFETAQSAEATIKGIGDSELDAIDITDDYGQRSFQNMKEIASIVMTDESRHAEFQNQLGLLALERNNQFQIEIGKRPDLKFLQGATNPLFDKR